MKTARGIYPRAVFYGSLRCVARSIGIILVIRRFRQQEARRSELVHDEAQERPAGDGRHGLADIGHDMGEPRAEAARQHDRLAVGTHLLGTPEHVGLHRGAEDMVDGQVQLLDAENLVAASSRSPEAGAASPEIAMTVPAPVEDAAARPVFCIATIPASVAGRSGVPGRTFREKASVVLSSGASPLNAARDSRPPAD